MMEMAVKMVEAATATMAAAAAVMAAAPAAGDSFPAAGIMGEHRPLAPFLHGFLEALPHGDGIHGGGKNVAVVAANSWVERSSTN